jgi:hypothetical protein
LAKPGRPQRTQRLSFVVGQPQAPGWLERSDRGEESPVKQGRAPSVPMRQSGSEPCVGVTPEVV